MQRHGDRKGTKEGGCGSSSRAMGIVRTMSAVKATTSGSIAGKGRSKSRCAVRVGAATAAAPFPKRDARLVLEDGSVWHGEGFGAKGTSVGEVVFNTSLTGYQEIMTDPSYAGQFVVFTVPHIGNVGINDDDMEASKCHLGGILVRQRSQIISNYRATKSLEDFCVDQNVIGISDLDTRAITLRVREQGSLVGVMCTDESIPDAELVGKAMEWSIEGKDLISSVTTSAPYEWVDKSDPEWEFSDYAGGRTFNVTALDFGIKKNILRRLASYGCKVTVLPASATADEVKATNPDGIFLSNGPGDPSAVPYAVETVKQLLGFRPMFGICMGHQVLSQALGGVTYKLKFGHHGGNHPVRHEASGRVEISAQNHNYAADPASLPAGAEITHLNLNDNTVSGIRVPDKMAFGIQYHPEASPGPHDSDTCFKEFIEMMT